MWIREIMNVREQPDEKTGAFTTIRHHPHQSFMGFWVLIHVSYEWCSPSSFSISLLIDFTRKKIDTLCLIIIVTMILIFVNSSNKGWVRSTFLIGIFVLCNWIPRNSKTLYCYKWLKRKRKGECHQITFPSSRFGRPLFHPSYACVYKCPTVLDVSGVLFVFFRLEGDVSLLFYHEQGH